MHSWRVFQDSILSSIILFVQATLLLRNTVILMRWYTAGLQSVSKGELVYEYGRPGVVGGVVYHNFSASGT